jgi:oligoribonuclease NrnB/cAMP/cGMP phosphodiesterase (DHH superfamily)
MSKKITVFTDADLDGAACVLVLKWLLPSFKFNHKATNERNFRETFQSWVNKGELNNTDEVYICDLNVASDCQDIIDLEKVKFIDHHDSIKKIGKVFNKASVTSSATPSCASLVYNNICKISDVVLNNHQKLLIALVDDYDSYTLKYPASLHLNTVFYAQQGDRIQAFCNTFKDGFKGFNNHQNNIIRFHTLKVNQIIKELQIFQANIPLDGKTYKIVSMFADYAINEVAHHVIKVHNADIAVVINLKNNTVSFRKNKTIPYDISILAKKLASGDGNENAAGGTLTPQMLAFSNIFKPL